MKRLSLTAAAQDDGLDVVEFLVRAGGLAPARAEAAARGGGVFIDGRRLTRWPVKVHSGQQITARLDAPGARPDPQSLPPIEVVFEDGDLLVVAKPAGVPTQATASGWEGTVTAWAADHLGRRSPDSIGLVHRLDRDTSGLLVMGKTPASTAALARAFREGAVHKRYLAVAGGPVSGGGVVEQPLRKDPGHRARQAVAPPGQGAPASTRYQALSPPRLATAVACWPLTGKTHQIRVHMAFLGAPLVGGANLYGGPREVAIDERSLAAARPLLHAQSLVFEHPSTRRSVEFTAPPPPDLEAAVALLGPLDAAR